MRWPWPSSNDLDTHTWPRDWQDVPPYQNEVSVSTASKVTAQTDTQTDRHPGTMKTLPLPHTQEVITGADFSNWAGIFA